MREVPAEMTSMRRLCAAALLSCLWLPTAAVAADPSGWTPAAWAKEDTLDLATNVPGEGPYAFPVWLVVLDDQLYVRLGSRAARRVERSAPGLGVKIAGVRFEGVRCQPVPDLVPRVAAAMAQKYRSDVLIHCFPHPLTCRLVPE
jgi:hypothetical protein